MNLSPIAPPLSREWQRAFDNALACALATRLGCLVRGVSHVPSEHHIRSLVSSALPEAMLGFQRHADARCLHVRCREEAIVVAVAAKEAKLLGQSVEELEMANLTRLHEFLDGRS